MAKTKETVIAPEKTLEELLDTVFIAREDLLTIEKTLERLRADISKVQKQKMAQARSIKARTVKLSVAKPNFQ
jgi:ABC-type sugar transport system ATPase subunit